MSPQQNRFRVIHLHSRRSGQSIEQLKEAMHALLKEYDSVPSLQRNLLHREVCFATSDAPSLFQSANVSGSHSAHDIIVILDFVSREGWEEVSGLRVSTGPRVLKRRFNLDAPRSADPADPEYYFECGGRAVRGDHDHHEAVGCGRRLYYQADR
ncbi:hypothetical protein DFH09DRAFT_146849 [Mycena vulgaris]|nr:hypothetical protein DFH09DRAFT_146849 [Mycena vulgaris]